METKKPKPLDDTEGETRSDGWERFRSAVQAAAKSGPKHRTKKQEPQPQPQPQPSVVKDKGKC